MEAITSISLAGARVAHSERRCELPLLLEHEQSFRVVTEDDLAKASQSDRRVDVAKIENIVPIWRSDGLLEHHQKVIDARLAGTVRAEEDRQRSQLDSARVLPTLEVSDSQTAEHRASLSISAGVAREVTGISLFRQCACPSQGITYDLKARSARSRVRS